MTISEDKLKELEVEITKTSTLVNLDDYTKDQCSLILDLITAYRQVEKYNYSMNDELAGMKKLKEANAELLEALSFIGHTPKITAKAMSLVARNAHDKHKGE